MTEIKRHIAHFDLDAFFVSVEVLKDPSLLGKPLIVGGDGQRGIVAACSYEARKFGIHSAMPSITAKKLCPHAIFRKGSYADYSRYSRWVTDIIADSVPLYEKASIDEFYCDLTGMEKYFIVDQFAKDLRAKITRETGLPISCGLSGSKLVSKMATNEAKPNGFLKIPHGSEAAFLWPMPVGNIPMVGKQTTAQLQALNIFTIEDLAKTSLDTLEHYFGKTARRLLQKANGIDDHGIEPYSEQKSFSHETTFHDDSDEPGFLNAQLVKLTEETAYELRQDQKLTGCITIKLRYADFTNVTRQEVIPYTALDDSLLAKAKLLFKKLYTGKNKLRLMGVRFSHLIPMTCQMNLFDDDAEKLELYKTIDKIKNQFGQEAIQKGGAIKKER